MVVVVVHKFLLCEQNKLLVMKKKVGVYFGVPHNISFCEMPWGTPKYTPILFFIIEKIGSKMRTQKLHC